MSNKNRDTLGSFTAGGQILAKIFRCITRRKRNGSNICGPSLAGTYLSGKHMADGVVFNRR